MISCIFSSGVDVVEEIVVRVAFLHEDWIALGSAWLGDS